MLGDRDLGGGRAGAKTQRQEVTMQVWRQAHDSYYRSVSGKGKMEVGAGPRSCRGHLTVEIPIVTSFLSGSLNWKHVQDEWGCVAAGRRGVWIWEDDPVGCGNSSGDR